MKNLESKKIKQMDSFQKKIEKKLNAILWELNCSYGMNNICFDYLKVIEKVLKKHNSLD